MACVHGHGSGASLGKQLEVVCHPWVQMEGVGPLSPALSLPAGFIGALYHIPASGIISYILDLQEGESLLPPLQEDPQNTSFPPEGGLGAVLIPKANNLLLWRIFLSSSQWKCVYRETVFDLDKCFTDVNKAGGQGDKR